MDEILRNLIFWILLAILFFIIWILGRFYNIYNKLTTHQEVEYHINGKVKFIGKKQRNKRKDRYDYFDEDGQLDYQIFYENGISYEEIHFNPLNHKIWKKVNKSGTNIYIENAPLKCTSNQKFIFEESKKNASNFQFASRELKDNKEFILKLVNINPSILEFVSDEFQNDSEVVMEALKSSSTCSFAFAIRLD